MNKNLYFLILTFFAVFSAFSQSKIVVKNVIPMDGGDSLIHYYLPLKSNISDAKYDTLKPASIQNYIEKIPSDSFELKKNGKTQIAIGISVGNEKQYYITNNISGKKSVQSSEINGQVSEYRAAELLGDGKDVQAGIVFGKFKYNNKDYLVITNSNLENSVIKLVDQILHPPKVTKK